MVDFARLKEISHSTSMLDVLDYYGIDYINNGTDRYKCVCPFHDDHDPSMVIYTNNEHRSESFCCYVDNIAGDSFHFIRSMEGGDFKQAWRVLCHVNQITDEEAGEINLIDSMLREAGTHKEEKRSTNLVNYQISRMYYKLYEDVRNILDENRLKELDSKIQERLQALDDYLETSPSYAEVHQYMKMEINKIKEIQKQFKTNKGFTSDW